MNSKQKNKKKAVFIDNPFHKKTLSTIFVKEILSKEFELTELWYYSWKGGERVDLDYLNKEKFHTVFFFQMVPPLSYLKRSKCKNIVWFPMYDQQENEHYSSYIPYLGLNMKIFSFSKKLCDNLKKAGLDCYYYKYHPKPVDTPSLDNESKKVFFWMRRSPIDWSIVKKLLGKNKIERVIIKMTPDPNQKLNPPSKEDIVKYNIQIIDHWLDKEEYNKLLSSCNIFIAPRPSEGIGISFIEALSKGMCVIAPDNSTMNEYIIHNKNGLLYDLKNPKELDLSNLTEICKNTIKKAKEDYESWEKTKDNILNDIQQKNRKCSLMKLIRLRFIYIIWLPYVLGIKLKNNRRKVINKLLKFTEK